MLNYILHAAGEYIGSLLSFYLLTYIPNLLFKALEAMKEGIKIIRYFNDSIS